MTDSLAGFVWFAAPESLLILCALKDINVQDDFARIVNSRSELQGHMCRCSWRSRQGRSRYHQPHIGPVHLWQYEQKDEYKHQDLGISLWRLRQRRHSWKLRQLLPQKCHRRRPGNEKISPKLCSFFSLTKSDISSYGPLNDTSEPRKYDLLQHRCRWFWRITCSKLFARDTISSAIACVRVK